LTDLLGNGIFNVDGAAWHSQRKTAAPMFSNDQFKNHIWQVIGANCTRVSQILRDVPTGETVDLFNLMNRFTLDTIGSVGFARDIGSLDNAESPFLKSTEPSRSR